MRSSGKFRIYLRPPLYRSAEEYGMEGGWCPPTDVYETRDTLVIKMAIAGVEREDVHIRFFTDGIVISGLRRPQKESGTIAYHQMEIRSGQFKRVVKTQAPLDSENTRFSYENGLLTVSIPKLKGRHKKSQTVRFTL